MKSIIQSMSSRRTIIPALFALAMSCTHAFATSLTGLMQMATTNDGSYRVERWNTGSSDAVANLFVISGTNIDGAFVNGPLNSQMAISLTLTPGNYTFTTYGGGGSTNYFHSGLNLFLNGNSTTPRISVFGQQQTNDNLPYPSFAANSSPNSQSLFGSAVAASGTLGFSDGTNIVTLTDYRWARPDVYSRDRIFAPTGNFGQVGADGAVDWVGQFSLNVTAVPEPSSIAFGALGVGAVIAVVRTRRNRRD